MLPSITHHPGEILLDGFPSAMEVSQNALVRAIRVSPRRVNELVLGKRAENGRHGPEPLTANSGWSKGFLLGVQSYHTHGRADATSRTNSPIEPPQLDDGPRKQHTDFRLG